MSTQTLTHNPEEITSNHTIINHTMRPLFSKPIVVPQSILKLKNARLAGKMFLAMCLTDPRENIVRLRRALKITCPGLRKLEQRLVEEGLLTLHEYQRIVHVEQSDSHCLSEFKSPKTKQKVARTPSSTPASDPHALVVAPELLECRYLLPSEKLLLAFYVAHPNAQNEHVIETLGISLSGLKKVKRGLLKKRVLVPTVDGCTIRLPGYLLIRNSEGGHFVPESEAVINGYEVAQPAPQLTPAKDVYNYWVSCLEQMRRNPDTTQSYCLNFTTNMIKRIETESPASPEREAALVVMKQAENVFFARNVLGDIIKKCEAKALAWTGNATPDQLVAFREKVEGMMLAGMPEPKFLAMLTKSISQ